MKKKALFVEIEIHEESIEEITRLEKRLMELKVSHRIDFEKYGNIKMIMKLPYDSIIARGHTKLLITLYTVPGGDITIPLRCIDSINIVTGDELD